MEHTVPHPYIITSFKKFIEIPIRGLKWVIHKLKLPEIFKEFVKDPRQAKSPYAIESILMAGLQLPLFREPSRHHFYQHLNVTNAKIGNSAYLAGIKENRFPSTRVLEDTYQLINPSPCQEALFALFANLIKGKFFTNHSSLLSSGRILLGIDAFYYSYLS